MTTVPVTLDTQQHVRVELRTTDVMVYSENIPYHSTHQTLGPISASWKMECKIKPYNTKMPLRIVTEFGGLGGRGYIYTFFFSSGSGDLEPCREDFLLFFDFFLCFLDFSATRFVWVRPRKRVLEHFE